MTLINTNNLTKAERRRVRRAFDAEKLQDICVREDFSEYAERVQLEPSQWNTDRFYWYKDNGSKILAVAHLDTVQENRTCTIQRTAAGLLACSGGLDDRLGAYVILELLPKLGLKFDWLLTTDEESGASTADEFWVDKQYNWIIEFDRGGSDVVMYNYETPELVDLVKDTGADVGIGSFTDICSLEHLGRAAFNWGVGYQNYHSQRSHAWLEDTFRMVARFLRFHHVNKDKVLRHDGATWCDDDQVIKYEDLIVCRPCGITFDDEDDAIDHMEYFHPDEWDEFAKNKSA